MVAETPFLCPPPFDPQLKPFKRVASYRTGTHYNFCRQHKTTRVTPAMAAGIETTFRDAEWIVGLIDSRAPKPRRPNTYKKRKSN